MYKKISQLLTNYFIHKGTVTADQYEVYAYGFEVLISTLVYTFIFILIAFVTRTLLASLIFWIGFFIVRTIAGGYHAKTYIVCHMLFMLNHVIVIAALKLTSLPAQKHIAFALILLSAILIFLFAPVDHPNKPFIKGEEQRFRKLSCIYALFILVLAVILYAFSFDLSEYPLSFAIGTFSAAFALTGAKIQQKKGAQKQ